MEKVGTVYQLRIKTNKYAGNFEREMTAYCTGWYGDCEVGKEEAEKFKADVDETYAAKLDDLIRLETGDQACFRPCEMDYGDSSAFLIFLYKKPSSKFVDFIRDRAVEFGASRTEDPIEIESVTVLEFVTTCKTISV